MSILGLKLIKFGLLISGGDYFSELELRNHADLLLVVSMNRYNFWGRCDLLSTKMQVNGRVSMCIKKDRLHG